MDITTARIVATLVSPEAFLACGAWAYARRNKGRFEDAASIPFQQD